MKLKKELGLFDVDRDNASFAPKGKTMLRENDVLTVVGEPGSINQLFDQFILSK